MGPEQLPLNIVHLPPPNEIPIPTPATYTEEISSQHVPLVVDNGSSTLRFGWASMNEPRCAQNASSKYKERRQGKQLLLFGEGIDSESGARAQSKTPWEGDVLVNMDALENALDYAFTNLSIDSASVDHPIIMTERLASPLHSRALTSELLFELYGAPSVTYAVDAPMSFFFNNRPSAGHFLTSGLVVSFNTASTSVIPVLSGRGIMSAAKRIPWGAQHANEYFLKLINLKYPTFGTRVTTNHTSWLLRNHCGVAPDYTELMRTLADPLQLRTHEVVVQFPFALPAAEEKTEEELARIAERRREQGRKLQEIAAKARMEKLLQKENDLRELTELRDRRGEVGKREWVALLQAEGIADDQELEHAIKKLEADLKKQRKKEAADGGDDILEEPSFPLLDTPDEELDEEGLKEKRKQKLMKAGFDARVRARKEKEREREERAAEERADAEERERDLAGWSSRLRQEQEDIMNRIKDRTRRRAALGDRKSAASQARMKSIASLAADERIPKKRRKGTGEDMFGADDADWAIYRKINTAAPSSDEEDDLAQLASVEQKLLAHDPTFDLAQTHAARASARSALLTAFRPIYDDGDVEGQARIHLSTERWRACEPWFTPSLAGVDSAGLGEILQHVLGMFSLDVRGRLVQNVFLTGAPAALPGLPERLEHTLRPVLPTSAPLRVVRAADPAIDAWRGMAAFARTEEFPRTGVSKAEYEEGGGERVKRWFGGNWNASLIG
ncbi:actin-like ATPase domain-containing protein [Vararia minispora EC-137]|uniref:Actin-like ATPase domain-containing protein n=1 Tax=Vararia minispora EC-137 TaxID=1314806 RepID=A0ACB8QFH0_9AGAM|nr:actin-like ATPase domain-containing protein [Vararia minispora EC-137]